LKISLRISPISVSSAGSYFGASSVATECTNNASKVTDRSPGCQRLGATYRLKCRLSVAEATRTSSLRRRRVASAEASAAGNFANAENASSVNGSRVPPLSSFIPVLRIRFAYRQAGRLAGLGIVAAAAFLQIDRVILARAGFSMRLGVTIACKDISLLFTVA